MRDEKLPDSGVDATGNIKPGVFKFFDLFLSIDVIFRILAIFCVPKL